MTLIINGYNFSSNIQQKTDIIETPRYIEGVNAGRSISGMAIRDRVAVKYDLQVAIKPLKQPQIALLLSMLEQDSVQVEYTSMMLGSLRTINAQAVASSIKYLTDANGNRIYGEATIHFEEN